MILTTHALLLMAAACAKPAAHSIRNWWNEQKDKK